jgi:DNA-binding transcriptional regulator YhcF (GntR family)
LNQPAKNIPQKGSATLFENPAGLPGAGRRNLEKAAARLRKTVAAHNPVHPSWNTAGKNIYVSNCRGAFLELRLPLDSQLPLTQQLAHGIRSTIVTDQLRRGTRPPSSRRLAGELGVSRNTVLDAYGQLLEEGFVESRLGSGTFVTLVSPRPKPRKSVGRTRAVPVLSEVGSRLDSSHSPIADDLVRPFNVGIPALDDENARDMAARSGRESEADNAMDKAVAMARPPPADSFSTVSR